MSKIISELSAVVEQEWSKIKRGRFFATQSVRFDRAVYIQTMLQIFHYTKNNAINQAAAAYAADYSNRALLRFALKHALEELGHEQMIVRDLSRMGISEKEIIQSRPLPATQALNGYLYTVALKLGPIPRLGYSFWAEDAYEHIQPLLDAARRTFQLEDENMSFFVAHSSIDQKHSKEVRHAIVEHASSDAHQEELKDVARTTLFLTGQILESAYEAAMAAAP